MVSPTDHMFESSRQQNCTNDMYTIVNRYHRLKSSEENLVLTMEPIDQSCQQIKPTIIDEQSTTDSIWSSSGTLENFFEILQSKFFFSSI
jgi:hypothetical protein